MVVATPRTWYAAFALYLPLALVVVIAISRVPLTYLLKRSVVGTAVRLLLLLPFVAAGPQTRVLGVSVSQHGLGRASRSS